MRMRQGRVCPRAYGSDAGQTRKVRLDRLVVESSCHIDSKSTSGVAVQMELMVQSTVGSGQTRQWGNMAT
ncbi:unnamed protein product [Protopolystoma xenopodis]|uniref:Uncharacterized protein n=1 Tax=Protopolystoma xenopodis TaxID=117903 RepID=A0A3S5CT61_9PLAT|nr:unnamed protein product [Protopolystoma xenopodis]